MNTDLRAEIERSLGEGPPLVDTDLVARGRRALLRRRVAAGAGAACVAVVAVTGFALSDRPATETTHDVGPATGHHQNPPVTVVTDATLSGGDLVRLEPPNELHVRPGVRLLALTTEPHFPVVVTAAELEYRGTVRWYQSTLEGNGDSGSRLQTPVPGQTFYEWAAPGVPQALP